MVLFEYVSDPDQHAKPRRGGRDFGPQFFFVDHLSDPERQAIPRRSNGHRILFYLLVTNWCKNSIFFCSFCNRPYSLVFLQVLLISEMSHLVRYWSCCRCRQCCRYLQVLFRCNNRRDELEVNYQEMSEFFCT